MATAQLIIPGATQVLATAVLNANSTSAQTVFTVPNGMRSMITHIVFRDNSFSYTGGAGAAMTATCAYSTAGAVPVQYATANAAFAASTTGVVTLVPAAASTLAANAGAFPVQAAAVAGNSTSAPVGVPEGNQGDNFQITLSYGSGTAPSSGNTIKVDVLGYLMA